MIAFLNLIRGSSIVAPDPGYEDGLAGDLNYCVCSTAAKEWKRLVKVGQAVDASADGRSGDCDLNGNVRGYK